MPKNICCVSVFISLPSNMSSYLERIETIIQEFNDVFGFERGIIFRAIHWKKNAIGQVTMDAQSAINDQLLREYDLMIAVIGDRLGEATARAESGTAEEIRIALEKKDDIFDGKHIQVLFRTRLDTNINQIDTDQIVRVKQFKTSLHRLALTAEFSSDDEIDGIVNRFLNSACQQMESRNREVEYSDISVTLASESSSVIYEKTEKLKTVDTSDESLGFYDELESANQAASAQAELIGAYGQLLTEMTSQIQEILQKYGDDQQKRRFDEIGAMLLEKSEVMEKIVCSMKLNSERHSASFENVLLMLDEFDGHGNTEPIEQIRDALLGTVEMTSGFVNTSIEAKESIERSPRATQKFNHGKREAAKVMGDMISLTEKIKNRFSEYASYLDSFLESRTN